MTIIERIESAIGLHTILECRYYVDHYEAKIINEQETVIFTGEGEDLKSALIHLNNLIEKRNQKGYEL